MASFQAKIGWEMPRMRQNKNFLSVPFLPDANRKFQKKRKNFKKPLWLHFKPKQVGKGRKREKIKNYRFFRSYPRHKR